MSEQSAVSSNWSGNNGDSGAPRLRAGTCPKRDVVNHYFHNSDSSGNCSCVRHCLSAIANYHLNSTNRELPPSFGPYFIGTFFDVILIGIAIFGIAQVLFTYALQKRNGRILLYCGYVSIVVANSLDFFVLIKTPYLSSLPLVVPGILYGYAYYLARDRIIRGEIPAPAAPVQGQGTPASNI